MEHGKVDSKNNHYVHSHWRAGLGGQIQVRLWSVFRKSGCSLSSSSQDSTPLITSKPGKLKPDSISKSWHLLMRMKKGGKVGFFLYWQAKKIKSLAQDVFRAQLWVPLSCAGLFPECHLCAVINSWVLPNLSTMAFAPSQESSAMAACAHPASWAMGSTAQKNWGVCLWQCSNRNCRNQHISHFLTKLSLCFRNSWQICSQTLQARGGEDPAQTVRAMLPALGTASKGTQVECSTEKPHPQK